MGTVYQSLILFVIQGQARRSVIAVGSDTSNGFRATDPVLHSPLTRPICRGPGGVAAPCRGVGSVLRAQPRPGDLECKLALHPSGQLASSPRIEEPRRRGEAGLLRAGGLSLW